VITKVLDWLGFGSQGHGYVHGGHGHDGDHRHTHGVVDPTIATTTRGIRAIKWSFLILTATAALQLAAVFLSHSVALLADTIHNIGDAATAIPLWIAFVLARKMPTPTFTYGYGRVEDLAGLAIVIIILLSALVAGYEAIDRLIHPRPVMNLGWLAAAGVIGFLGNEAVAMFRIHVGRQINSAALIADGYHARTDGLTSLAVVLGALGVWMGYTLADPIIGLVITAVIMGIVWQSARAVLTRMLDGVEPQILSELRLAAEHAEGVFNVKSVRARWLGHRLYAEMDLALDPTLSLTFASKAVSEVKEDARRRLPALGGLTVDLFPAAADRQVAAAADAEVRHSH